MALHLARSAWRGSLLAVLLLCGQLSYADKLAKIHQDIEQKYEQVEHLSADQFLALDPVSTILFDVRDDKEYRVSHLDNAVRVSPGISAEDFLAAHGNLIDGKTAVFYCSVGHRSSKLIDRIASSNAAAEQDLVLYNLTGGIFRWVNEDRELDSGLVHPNNWFRERLITDKDKISYKPANQSKESE